MSVRPVRVAYGGSVLLTPDIISVTDADTELVDLIFTIELEPRHGNVTNDERRLTEGSQFTYDDLVNSVIR